MRYEATTGLAPLEALARAIVHFGSDEEGLELISLTSQSLVFQGRGGYVAITVKPGTTITLELETREWDVPVRTFMAQMTKDFQVNNGTDFSPNQVNYRTSRLSTGDHGDGDIRNGN